MPQTLRRAVLASLSLAAALAGPALLAQESTVGLGVGRSSRFDVAIYRAELAIAAGESWDIVPNFEYLRADEVRRYVSSLDVHYKLPWRAFDQRLYGYLGLGLGVITDDPVGPADDTTSDGQVNFLGGVAFEGGVTPFFQLRSDARRVNIMFGVRLAL